MRGVFGASVVLALALCATGEAFAQVRADDVKEDLKGLYERHLRLELRDGKLFVDGKEVDRGDPEAIRKALPRF